MNPIAQRLRSLAARTALDGIAEEMRAIADEITQQAQGPWIATKDEPPPVGVRVFWMDIHTNQVGYDTYLGEPYYFNSTHWMLIPTLSSTSPPAPQPAPLASLENQQPLTQK